MFANPTPRTKVLVLIGAMLMLTSMRPDFQGGPTTGEGRRLFETNCARCHGMDGAKRKWGAKDLRYSRLTDDRIVLQMARGKGIMPAFGKKLTQAELGLIVPYVKGLRVAGS